jgi:hypothetical protein
MLDGEATQVPSETVRTSPLFLIPETLSLIPETVGLVVATGAPVITAVEAVNWLVVATELVALTLAITYLPRLDSPLWKFEDGYSSNSSRGTDELV